MATQTLPSKSVKVIQSGPQGAILTNDDAVSYHAESCFVFPMVLKAGKDFSEEMAAWDEASDEALENFDKDFPPLEE
jgi:hypothetical protein